MKKSIILLAIITIILCLTPQANAEKTSTPGNQSASHYQEIVDDGWIAWTASENAEINDPLAELFGKATANIEDFEYNPVAFIESKTVAGYYYRFLCETRDVNTDAEPRFAIVEIFKDLDGNVKVISIDEEEPHSITEIAAFAEDGSIASAESSSIDNIPADGTTQTIQGDAGDSMTATVIVTFVKE